MSWAIGTAIIVICWAYVGWAFNRYVRTQNDFRIAVAALVNNLDARLREVERHVLPLQPPPPPDEGH